jgi:hypothetical protein
MSNAGLAIGNLVQLLLAGLLGLDGGTGPRRRPRQAPGYHEASRADVYEAILKEDPAIQPETLSRMFW